MASPILRAAEKYLKCLLGFRWYTVSSAHPVWRLVSVNLKPDRSESKLQRVSTLLITFPPHGVISEQGSVTQTSCTSRLLDFASMYCFSLAFPPGWFWKLRTGHWYCTTGGTCTYTETGCALGLFYYFIAPAFLVASQHIWSTNRLHSLS